MRQFHVRSLQCTVWVPDAEASGLGDQSPLKGALERASARFPLLSRRLQSSVFLIALLIMMTGVGAASGQTLLSLYELERGARPAALGGAFSGLADDAYAVVYNPAALAFLERASAHGLVESRFGRAVYGSVLAGGRNLGVGLVFLNVSNIPWRDENNKPVQAGSFEFTQVGFTVAGGISLADLPLGAGLGVLQNLAVGLRAKILTVSTLPEGSGAGFSLEPALFYKLDNLGGLGGLRIGVVLENLVGLGVNYGSGHSEAFPIGVRFGASLSPVPGATLAADIEANGTVHVGGEYKLSNAQFARFGLLSLAVRGGVLISPLLVQAGVGFGARLRGGLQLDYTALTHSELPLTHRLEVAYRFGFQSFLCPLLGRPCPAPEEAVAILPPTEEPELPEEELPPPPDDPPSDPPVCPGDDPNVDCDNDPFWP
ncbi:MAG: hypothetical protein K6T71_07325 [Candidatus Bipolaricaulota bacterium]|nr:hypothetical protein [Candidatus Bipolaricaulota bacterium]